VLSGPASEIGAQDLELREFGEFGVIEFVYTQP
jgi:hypothetical protein